jgi:hypothetical protein
LEAPVEAGAPGVRSRIARIMFGSSESISGNVYGTIVVMSAIALGAEGTRDPWRLIPIVAGTVIVLWFAHVYSHGLGEAITRGRPLDRAEFTAVARREFAIPLAAVLPVCSLFLGGVGLVRESTAVWIALGFGFATLVVTGIRYAALEHLDRRGKLTGVALNVAIGLGIIALEVAVAH